MPTGHVVQTSHGQWDLLPPAPGAFPILLNPVGPIQPQSSRQGRKETTSKSSLRPSPILVQPSLKTLAVLFWSRAASLGWKQSVRGNGSSDSPGSATARATDAATHLGDFDGRLTQAAIVRASAALPHQAAMGIIRGPPPLHGKPSHPFLLVLRSRPGELQTPHGPAASPGSTGAPAPALRPASPPSLPAPQLPPTYGETWTHALPTTGNASRGKTRKHMWSCAVSSLHATT